MKTSTAIAALVTALVGFGTVLPAVAQDASSSSAPPVASAAQDTAATPAPGQHKRGMGLRADGKGMGKGMGKGKGMGPGMGMDRPGGRLLALACSPRGAQALDTYFTRIQHRLELTVDQQKLFDTFRTKALTAQTSFADSCKSAMPDKTAGKPDMLAQLKAGLAVDQARLTAMNSVLPDFEGFFTSLSDSQKAHLMPHRGMGKGDGMKLGKGNGRHPAPDTMGAPPANP
jgi:hypothetical protein